MQYLLVYHFVLSKHRSRQIFFAPNNYEGFIIPCIKILTSLDEELKHKLCYAI